MAKKFKFGLKPVLRYREIIEDRKKKDFAEANRAVEEERMRRETMASERDETQEQVRQAYGSGQAFGEIVESYRYINILDLRLRMSEGKLVKLNQVLDQRRAALVEAQKNRKALELLRDKRKEQHDREVAREEQNELDALGIQVRRRRDSEER